MPAIIKPKLEGSTIIEVITGVFLITFAIALTVTIFSKTMVNSNLFLKHRAICTLDELVVKEAKEAKPEDEVIDYGDFLINVSSAPFLEYDSLCIVSYTATFKSTGKQIYTRKLLKYLQVN